MWSSRARKKIYKKRLLDSHCLCTEEAQKRKQSTNKGATSGRYARPLLVFDLVKSDAVQRGNGFGGFVLLLQAECL